MTEQAVIDLGTKTLWIAMLVAGPVLASTLIMGLLISVFQAATQINEQTLTFIPKIIAMTVVIAFFGPWMLQQMLSFTVEIFDKIPLVTR